jgi:hypothetical protein
VAPERTGETPRVGAPPLPFEQRDYVYTPSRDVAVDVTYFTDVLGARRLFAIEDGGVRVAMLELSQGPRVLLTDHLDGEAPILVYRVADLRRTLADLSARGWQRGRMLEIPQGPCVSFVTPGGQRIGIYERSRPGVEEHLMGRRDF